MGYLANQAGPVSLVLDLRITHERVNRSSDLGLNGHLRYPNDNDRSLNEAAAEKILKYRADYIVNSLDYYSYRIIGKLTAFLQIQEFSLRNPTVEESSPTSARPSYHSLSQK